jgi:hypothetical protein
MIGGRKVARWAAPVLGSVAVLALLGLARPLPAQLAFTVSALAIVFFPGIAATRLIAGSHLDRDTLPERMAVWFVVGIGLVAAVGLVGFMLKLRLRDVIPICVLTYIVLIALLIIRRGPNRSPGERTTTHDRHRRVSPVGIVLLAVAVGIALITLVTPRDYDDWYYLAYIKDYVVDTPLASEDAIFAMGNPATPRTWFGGGWWVLEALLARVSSVDPVACHQIYLPVLLLPFVVLAVYTLSRRLFRSAWAALLACGFQVLFYLSSAFPYKSAGWMVFARIAQDKVVSCFVVVPIAAALALRLFDRAEDDDSTGRKGLVYIYWIAVLTSVLVHGMGPVWCCLCIAPFALGEWLQTRTKASTLTLVSVVLPILAFAVILVSARGLVRAVIVTPAQDVVQAPGVLSGLYLPGAPFSLGTDTTNPIAWIFRENFRILNPLFIIRYPLAISGFVLTFALFRYVRSSMAARFLLWLTGSTLLLLFTPIGIALTGWFITPRMVFRLSWVFPWGLTIAFFLAKLKVRPFVTFLMLAAVILALARGDPGNYTALFSRMRGRNRPSPDAAAAFDYLGSRPSPQGVILASEVTGRMIPAFLPDGYPVNFRELGPVDQVELKRLVGQQRIDPAFLEEIDQLRVHYILIENGKPLAGALKQDNTAFVLRYENASYSIWEMETEPDGTRSGLQSE